VKGAVRGITTSASVRLLVGLAVMTVLVFGAAACGGSQDGATTEPGAQTTAQASTTETTQVVEPTTVPTTVPATVATTTTTEYPFVGSYTGEYEYEKPDTPGKFPVDFVVKADGSLEGVGEIYDGTFFKVNGILGSGGDFVAEGDVEGAGMKVTFTGVFTVANGVVTARGTWEGGGGEFSGAWTATHD
jgi:hypothetical protein